MEKKKKALVIGSDSFIAQKFLAYCKDHNFSGIARNRTILQNEIVINDFFTISEETFKNIDVVFNFAAIVHQPQIKDSGLYDKTNYKLPVFLAHKAKQAKVKLFVQMSTIAVYGNTSNITISTPHNPQNTYGNSKLKSDEELLKMQDENFKVSIIRPPMVYGGGKAPGNMMRLIKLADKGIPLPFKGIDNKRDFINVNNLVQYLAIIAEKQLNGIHLISGQEQVSTEYLLNTIAKYLNKKVPLIRVPNWILKALKAIRPNEYDKLFGTLQIQTNFPFENMIKKYSVEDGIRQMIEWYKANKN